MTKTIMVSQEEFDRFAIAAFDAAFDEFYTYQVLSETANKQGLEFKCTYDIIDEWVENKRKAY